MGVREIDPVQVPGEHRITRGKFLGVVGGGLALGVTVVTGKTLYSRHERAHERDIFERDKMNLFDQRVKVGMTDNWMQVTVWPGMAIIPPDIQLYSTAALLKGTEIEWPKAKGGMHLGVQRPFLVGESAGLNQEPVTYNPDHGNDTVLGFWLPDSQRLAFCDQTVNSNHILLPTHSEAAIYTGDYSGIAGEKISLEFPFVHKGLTYRYMNSKISDGLGDSTTVTKVIGRSDWLNSGEVGNNYYAFLTGEGNDLVQLPEAK